jgi:hypothetical protein
LDVDHVIRESELAPLFGFLDLRLDSVTDRCPGLTEELAGSELLSTVARVAGLQTLPEFHANAIRLEVLTHLAVAHCGGKNNPTSDQIRHWLNQSLVSLPDLEDPVEDVFITNVTSGLGNHRLFEGLWESADFWTQNILDVLSAIPNEPHGAKLRWHVTALLKLSEDVAARSRIDRWTVGGGIPQVDLEIPDDAVVEKLGRRVLFESADLERLNIEREALVPFILADRRLETRSEEIGRSALGRRPLLLVGERVVLALPSAVSIAIRRFVLEECRRENMEKALASNLRALQRSLLFGEVMQELKASALGVPPQRTGSADLPQLDDAICTFDSGRRGHIVLLHDDLGEANTNGFTAPHVLSPSQTAAFAEYLEQTAKDLGAQPDYQGGLTLVVTGGIGRGGALGFGEFPEGWHLAAFSLGDLYLVSHMTEMSLLRLWKMKEQLSALRQCDTTLTCVNGDIGFLAYWCDQGWSFVPVGCSVPV